jgi:hypothetical protein
MPPAVSGKCIRKRAANMSDGVIAPQSAVTPNYLLWYAHDPARYAGISGINKLPPPPNFPSCRWADFIGIIVTIAAEAIFVAIVMLARVKSIVWVVFLDIGFKSPVLISSQTRRSRGLTDWNDVIIDQVLIVAGRMVIEFAFRRSFARCCPAPGLYPSGREN